MLADLLGALAAHDPGAVALIDDGASLTYGELRDRAGRIAALVRERHGGGQVLAIPATSDAGFVTALLGIMASGNVPLPMDPDLPEPGRRLIGEVCGGLGRIEPIDETALGGVEPAAFAASAVPAMVLLTSGTSGYPKGVIISHENLAHSCRAISSYLEYERYPSAAVVLPLHYSYALLSQVCCMLYVGGTVRLFQSFRNPLKFARAVGDLGLQTFCGVPSTYHALCVFHGLSPLHVPSVRVLCSAGAAMDQTKYDTVKEIFPNAVFFNNYGMTEATPRISFIRDDDPRFHAPTCGRPMDGVEVRIVDPESHEPVPDGTHGVLAVRGPNVTGGYLNDPEATREAFTADGFLLSGDVAYVDEGYIYLLGRQDDIFNVGGEKIAPLEIERALNRHEAVELSGVTGVPDEQRGHVPVAYVKLRGTVSRKTLVEFLGTWLPKVKIPLRYLEVSGFPMTSNGKLQRSRLAVEESRFVVREIL